MKRLLSVFLASLLLTSLFFTTALATEDSFTLSAKAEQAIRSVLGLGANETITAQALKNLTALDLNDSDLDDLTFLSQASGLTDLNLEGNRISDITPLSGLKSLKVLRLSDNRVEDLHPLDGLSQLELLTLSTNFITDISPLSSLDHLQELYLADNRITDIGPLAHLGSLKTLHLDDNRISELPDMSAMVSLEYLFLAENRLSEVDPLSALRSLGELDLNNNSIKDILSLGALTWLRILSIENNRISNLEALSGLKGLEKIYLKGNPVEDLSPLSALRYLELIDADIAQQTPVVSEPTAPPQETAAPQPTATLPPATPAVQETPPPIAASTVSALTVTNASSSSLSFSWQSNSVGNFELALTSGAFVIESGTHDSTQITFSSLVPNTSYTLTVTAPGGNTITQSARTSSAPEYRDFNFRWKTGSLISLPAGNDMFDDSGKTVHKELNAEVYLTNRSKKDYYFHLAFFFHQSTSSDKEFSEMIVLRMPDNSAISFNSEQEVKGSWREIQLRHPLNFLLDFVIEQTGGLAKGQYTVELYFDQQFAGKGSFKVK